MDPDRRLTLKAAAELAAVPVKTLRRSIREGRLEAHVGEDGSVTVKVSALGVAGFLRNAAPEPPSQPPPPQEVVQEEPPPPAPASARIRDAEDAYDVTPSPPRETQRETHREAHPSPAVDVHDAGPVPHVEEHYEPPPEPPPDRHLPARLDERGAWLSGLQAQELFRHLLAEREASLNAWKERTESLYREIIEEQRERLHRIEDRNRELMQQIQDALKRVPKLLEVEALEDASRDLRKQLDEVTIRSKESETERDRYREHVRQLESDLSRSERRARELADTVRRLRRRRFWDRLMDREDSSGESA